MPQIPHTSLSLPSLTQPHFAAATASIGAGLFAYVVSLYVDRRDRNDEVDEGRYSEAEAGADITEKVGGCAALNGVGFLVREAARFKMATRCGAVLDKLSSLDVEAEDGGLVIQAREVG